MNATTIKEFKAELAKNGFTEQSLGTDGSDIYQRAKEAGRFDEQWQIYWPVSPFAKDGKWTARHFARGTRSGAAHDIELTLDGE